ncbi:MAG: superoxide dismutase [Oscillospiraceae bacterium]|jgi:Fe-Mn family superoxide dismutase|nr:superoxide dismutase [Oscillospiraceae bacterium]
MPESRYPFTLPPLPYAYDALEPHIDEETMRYHHDKHFAAYISNLNTALAPYPALQRLTLEQLLTCQRLPFAARAQILRSAGGVYNHAFFFNHLSPGGAGAPDSELQARIDASWGSMSAFRSALTRAAESVFGSGWAALAERRGGALFITTTANQDTVLNNNGGAKPRLLIDVWEHAYYLKYKNDRASYIENLWSVLSFRGARQ